MSGGLRSTLVAFAAALSMAAPARAATAEDFSARLDTLWDFNAPAVSEARFRAALRDAAPRSREAYEISTQLARSLGLQRKFDEADATLDGIVDALDTVPTRVRVRYLLERGRVQNSSGAAGKAVPLFKDALAAAKGDTLTGADFYRVDALHMLGIAAPASEQLDWNLKALAAADASSDARARGWRASLLNNIGWTYFERGDYATALARWRQALAAREATGSPAQIRAARWAVARGLRAVGRLKEAEAAQRALAKETESAGTPDGYVYEELAEIAVARHNPVAAKEWAAKAYALLKDDAGLKAAEPQRIARMARLADVKAAR